MTAILFRSQVAIGVLLLSIATANGQQRPLVRDRIQRETRAFELDEVRLRDSPFKRAMMLDAECLLRVEPDRLLSWFRKEAGLTPKGEVYACWEARGIAGHSLGHYLSACAMMFAQPGEMQPERDHNMHGEQIETGEHLGRKWRHALNGGWISFDLKVPPDQPVSLVSTYWSSETGARNFDILVDGVKIANQSLRNNKPGQFFDHTYNIPPELTRNKTKITVRFQALPGNMAGGFYGVRIIRTE